MMINPFGESYPEEDSKNELTLNRIKEYIEQGGVFVCTGGWPFYYADSPQGIFGDKKSRVPDRTRVKRFFNVRIDDSQWWPERKLLSQSDGSTSKYGPLVNKGGSDRVTVWRPIHEDCGAVEKILTTSDKRYTVLGIQQMGQGKIIMTGMALEGPSEFEKLASFLEIILTMNPQS